MEFGGSVRHRSEDQGQMAYIVDKGHICRAYKGLLNQNTQGWQRCQPPSTEIGRARPIRERSHIFLECVSAVRY